MIYLGTFITNKNQLVWWYMPITQVFGRLRYENPEFKVSLGYIGNYRSKSDP